MNECWEEGALRAYYDRELPPEELARAAAHLGACAECHARYNEIAGRAARVSSLMEALAVPPPAKVTAIPPRRNWAIPAAAGALALAAAAAMVFVMMPKPVKPQPPVATPHIQRVDRPVQATVSEQPQPETQPVARPAAPARMAHAAATHHAQEKPQTEYFVALDDQPIEAGVVMRVALDGNDAMQADVVFDREGRARAIRPVKDAK